MKVLCIDASNQNIPPYVIENETYSVIDKGERPCGECYLFQEFENSDWENWFLCSRFIPLSEKNINESKTICNEKI